MMRSRGSRDTKKQFREPVEFLRHFLFVIYY
jgi:hypothetical protein